MKELTQIVTLEITCISQLEDEECERIITEENKRPVKQMVEALIKDYTGADNVLVTNIQNFVREEKENTES